MTGIGEDSEMTKQKDKDAVFLWDVPTLFFGQEFFGQETYIYFVARKPALSENCLIFHQKVR